MPTTMTDAQYLTTEKFDALKKELEHLKSDKRKEVADHLEYAKKLGDLSENAEYHQAREEQAEVEDRIRYIENLLKTAVIAHTNGGAVITVGSTVRLEKANGAENKSMLYTIVGSEEADTAQGKISNVSPLGSALLGHKEGDTVTVQTPKGAMMYKVAALN
jgi:transcription elongation factor GreA